MSKGPKGVIVYQGPSMLNGEPIVALASLDSKNPKTGNMVQVWIMRSDMTPSEAKTQAKDDAVCGTCPHRQSLGGGCYVVLFHGPRQVYNSWQQGKHVELAGNEHLFSGRCVRLGAYGDPAALPVDVIKKIADLSDGMTGYTHQLHHPKFDPAVLDYCMVSVDTEKESIRLTDKGLRYFRVKTENMPVLDNEIECPADPNKGISCINCGMCNGAKESGKSIVIDVHGVMSARFVKKFERIPTVSV